MESLKGFTKNFLAEDAAELLATQRQALESQKSVAIMSSPYFAKQATPFKAVATSEVIELSDDEDSPRRPPPVYAETPIRKDEFKKEDSTPCAKAHDDENGKILLLKKDKKKSSSLLGSSNKLSLSQQRRAAENGSRYFQTVADPSGSAQSELIP